MIKLPFHWEIIKTLSLNFLLIQGFNHELIYSYNLIEETLCSVIFLNMFHFTLFKLYFTEVAYKILEGFSKFVQICFFHLKWLFC